MINTLNDITRYMDFLRLNGYLTTICAPDKNFAPCLGTLMPYEIHPLPICDYMKTHPNTTDRCWRHKDRLFAKKPQETYYACCYAGVEEFITPIKHNDKIILYLSVTGYRGSYDRSEQLKSTAKRRYSLDTEFDRLYDLLSTDIPPKETIAALSAPLTYMFSRLYDLCRERRNQQDPAVEIYKATLEFIRENYMNGISITDVAKNTGYSVSYLEHVFKRNSGVSVGKYITDLRLKKAAELLRISNMPISHIADTLCFSDSNYFSTVFKSKFGLSPRQYRKT